MTFTFTFDFNSERKLVLIPFYASSFLHMHKSYWLLFTWCFFKAGKSGIEVCQEPIFRFLT